MQPVGTPNFSERIKMMFDELDVNPNDVALKVGVSNVKFYNLLRGDALPSYKTIESLLTAYPRINANWLLKGHKPILHTSSAEIVGSGLNFVSLRLLSTTSNFTADMNLLHSVLVPVGVDVATYADSVVVSISDNSMTPRLPPQTKLLARPVPQTDWDYVSGGLYAVEYRNEFVVRRIKGNDLPTKNFLTIYAENEDFGYLHIRREDVKSLWKIVEIVGGGIDG